jgi:hypothetical protein
VKIETNYYPIKKISSDSDEFISIKWPEKAKKFQLTTGWFIFFVILAAALILIIVFWKKIWKWIKGERKQEKKVKEQLDIF